MTDRDYTVRSCTALLDAIGGAIHHIGNVHKYARPEDVPEHTMFVITTDGMENASRRYNSEKVKQMIEWQKAKYDWEFLFLGANIDAVETASQFGIGADRAVNYQCDSEGTALNYEVVSEAISSVRWTSALREPEWNGDAAARCRRQRSMGIGGARGPVDLGFAPTGTEWRLPQQALNRFCVTKALLAEDLKFEFYGILHSNVP